MTLVTIIDSDCAICLFFTFMNVVILVEKVYIFVEIVFNRPKENNKPCLYDLEDVFIDSVFLRKGAFLYS